MQYCKYIHLSMIEYILQGSGSQKKYFRKNREVSVESKETGRKHEDITGEGSWSFAVTCFFLTSVLESWMMFFLELGLLRFGFQPFQHPQKKTTSEATQRTEAKADRSELLPAWLDPGKTITSAAPEENGYSEVSEGKRLRKTRGKPNENWLLIRKCHSPRKIQ